MPQEIEIQDVQGETTTTESVNAQYIITNNVKDFKESVITAITPHDFDKMISSIK